MGAKRNVGLCSALRGAIWQQVVAARVASPCSCHPHPLLPTRAPCLCTHLSRNVLPEVLDAGHKLRPPQEISSHAVEQAGVAGARGQANVQLVQVVLALGGGGGLQVRSRGGGT